MEKLTFTTSINAPKEKVWFCLWDLIHYQTWVSLFSETSTVVTDNWKEGSKILFTDGNGNGMVSKVLTNQEQKEMTFQHLGMIMNGVEDTASDAVKAWSGCEERYVLTEKNGVTELTVTMDTNDEMKAYFSNIFPQALDKLKGLAEGTVKPIITVSTEVNAPVSKAWESWTTPRHIMNWNHASPDWHCPASTVDLKNGGTFSCTMAAKDGSFSFDFNGEYLDVKENESITAKMEDGRFWKTYFTETDGKTKVMERFEAETMNSLELQQGGWQAILNNFKTYTETI